jgi:hypothetical protein
VPSRETQQNHFIIGAIIGGIAAYAYTSNISSALIAALILGLAAAIFWK